MRIKVDKDKSIRTRNLVAKNLTVEQKINVGYYLLLGVVFIGIGVVFPSLLLIQIFRNGNLTVIILISTGCLYAIGFLTAYGLVYENRLISLRVKNNDIEFNKRTILAFLKNQYNTDLIYEGDEILSYYRRATFWKFALRVIVLFDQDQVFINISRHNQIGIKSFFHVFFSRIQAKSILARAYEHDNRRH